MNFTGTKVDGRSAPALAVRDITRRYYAMWFGYSFAGAFLFGVYPLFLRSRGLSQFQMNSVLAGYFVVTFLTDVPTGAFADAFGRRSSFVVGCGLRVAAFMCYFFAHAYSLFLVAEAIDGLGTTFCNGAIDAWGVDALDEAGFEGIRDRLFSRITQLTNLGFMGAAFIGAHVAQVNVAWPWLLGAAGHGVCAIVGARLMREDHRRSAAMPEAGAVLGEVWNRIRSGLAQGFNHRTVLLLSAANAMLLAAWAPYWMEWPLVFHDSFAVGVWIIGWIFCLFTVARAVGAEIVARRGLGEFHRAYLLAGSVICASVLLFAAGAVTRHPVLAITLLFGMNVFAGAMEPWARGWFNEQFGASARATLLSFHSTLATLGGSMGLLAGGYVADRSGIPVAWQLTAVILLGAMPCYLACGPGRLTTLPAPERSNTGTAPTGEIGGAQLQSKGPELDAVQPCEGDGRVAGGPQRISSKGLRKWSSDE